MRLAARGTRDRDDGEERIGDDAERAALRRRARHVHIQSVLLAIFGTLIAGAVRLLIVLSR